MIPNNLSKKLLEEDTLTDIVGLNKVKAQLRSALIAERHVLIVGPPGIGKTTLAKNIAKLLENIEIFDCPYHCSIHNPVCAPCKTNKTKNKKTISGEERFVRIQGSPDLTAEDLIGDIDPSKALQYGPLSIEAFTPGKIFKANNGILFFDELNRCPEKLQNALLQVLQEGRATIGSYDLDIEANFIFIATMNPEDSSTETISDVLLDRFDIVYMDYPDTLEDEVKIVLDHGKKFAEFETNLLATTVLYVRLLREHERLEKVPSVRATLGLYERAQTNALLRNAVSVMFKDVEAAMVSVLSHRIKLKPSAQFIQSPQEFVKQTLNDFMEKEGMDREAGEVP